MRVFSSYILAYIRLSRMYTRAGIRLTTIIFTRIQVRVVIISLHTHDAYNTDTLTARRHGVTNNNTRAKRTGKKREISKRRKSDAFDTVRARTSPWQFASVYTRDTETVAKNIRRAPFAIVHRCRFPRFSWTGRRRVSRASFFRRSFRNGRVARHFALSPRRQSPRSPVRSWCPRPRRIQPAKRCRTRTGFSGRCILTIRFGSRGMRRAYLRGPKRPTNEKTVRRYARSPTFFVGSFEHEVARSSRRYYLRYKFITSRGTRPTVGHATRTITERLVVNGNSSRARFDRTYGNANVHAESVATENLERVKSRTPRTESVPDVLKKKREFLNSARLENPIVDIFFLSCWHTCG